MKYFSLVILSFSIFAESLVFFSDSGIHGPSYTEMRNELLVWSEQHEDLVEVVDLGNTPEQRPYFALLLRKKNVESTKFISITGSIHGNEYLNIVDRLAQNFIQSDKWLNYFEKGGALFVLPVVNPDGYDRRRRYNSSGKDLNRDFALAWIDHPGFSEYETLAYTTWIEDYIEQTGSKFLISMDYHCCNGSLLYPWSYTEDRLPMKDLNAHVDIGNIMQENFPEYEHGITGDVLGYFPKGTSKDYWYGQYGALSFTFEGAWREEKNKLDQHLQMWESILNYLTHNPTQNYWTIDDFL